MLNYFYKDSISSFLIKSEEEIIGLISLNGRLEYRQTQLYAWEEQIIILKESLVGFEGTIFFEFSIPRMGRRVDCILILENLVFVIEFKIGETEFYRLDIDQVWDYALDLKNFHKPSHNLRMIPILCASLARTSFIEFIETSHKDNLLNPLTVNAVDLNKVIRNSLELYGKKEIINPNDFVKGSYSPTPTIIEAAVHLYSQHSVENITRSDADAINLNEITDYISSIIEYAKENNRKIICFVTGVPGAGKTLVGLKIATEHLDKKKGNTSVFLSGNKPLVDVLQEALTRDRVAQEKAAGNKITKKTARESVKAFIQLIHHYRDEYLRDPNPPYDHVAIFDEAQRSWDKKQTIKFMKQKKGIHDFTLSESEFLISCLDRHEDWAVIICLVGGGQEINTGEAGISEWIASIDRSFNHWETMISPNLLEHEKDVNNKIEKLEKKSTITYHPSLHLSVSMRSFRAEYLSKLVREILELNHNARETLLELKDKYPIILTRDLDKAKNWLKEKARGSERYGIVVSSQAYRLKPLAIDVRPKIDHVKWFLNDKEDIKSSYFLEDVATEFQVQGLELDWIGVVWDGDLRFKPSGWGTFSFVGSSWQNIHKEDRKNYLINAYRVLLTRARQGMIIVIPQGNPEDQTRLPEYYDTTFNYLKNVGLEIL